MILAVLSSSSLNPVWFIYCIFRAENTGWKRAWKHTASDTVLTVPTVTPTTLQTARTCDTGNLWF